MEQETNIQRMVNAYDALKEEAVAKVKELGTIDFSYLVEDTEDVYYDDRPQVIVSNKHGEVFWDIVESVAYDENLKRVMVYTYDLGGCPIGWLESFSGAYLFNAIMQYNADDVK